MLARTLGYKSDHSYDARAVRVVGCRENEARLQVALRHCEVGAAAAPRVRPERELELSLWLPFIQWGDGRVRVDDVAVVGGSARAPEADDFRASALGWVPAAGVCADAAVDVKNDLTNRRG